MGFQWEGGHFSVATQLGAQIKTNAQFLAVPIVTCHNVDFVRDTQNPTNDVRPRHAEYRELLKKPSQVL